MPRYSLLLSTILVGMSLQVCAAEQAPPAELAGAKAQCDAYVKEATALMVSSEEVVKRRQNSDGEVLRANAAASLGLLKLQLAERMGCPRSLPQAVVVALNAGWRKD